MSDIILKKVSGINYTETTLYNIDGGQRLVDTATPTALLASDGIILFDTSSLAISIDLPLASVGKISIPFKDIGANSNTNNITINRVGSDTIIDSATGQTSTIISSDGFSGELLSNGVDTWYLF
mgnify:CR=1 FL=1